MTTLIGSEKAIDAIGRVCHEANRAYCAILGDQALPAWDDLEPSYRNSTRAGVLKAIEGNTPQDSHASWMAERTAQGWVYGPTLDRAAKIHPNLVPYDQLPEAQKRKDDLFLGIVNALKVGQFLDHA